MPENSFADLERYESRTYSQNGEDGVIAKIFEEIGATSKFYVEFGTGADGSERNTRLLDQQGWRGLLMDACADDRHPSVRKEVITADNINALFAKHSVPDEFDLLSIDLDGNDYWVWQAIEVRYRPRVLIMEYNAFVPPDKSKTIAYDPDFRWRGTDYFGASLLALARLSKRKGYSLVYCEKSGVNAFFVRDDCAPIKQRPVEELYRPFNHQIRNKYLPWLSRKYAHPHDPELAMVDVA
jgi:hypothetical protein